MASSASYSPLHRLQFISRAIDVRLFLSLRKPRIVYLCSRIKRVTIFIFLDGSCRCKILILLGKAGRYALFLGNSELKVMQAVAFIS